MARNFAIAPAPHPGELFHALWAGTLPQERRVQSQFLLMANQSVG